MRHRPIETTLLAAAIAVVGTATGCATAPLRTETSTSEISAAEAVGANDVPQAALHLQLAKEELALAERLQADGKEERAASMLSRAEGDAELAVALSRKSAQRAEAETAVARVRALRDENKTSTANPSSVTESETP
jgi:hypothetical protein